MNREILLLCEEIKDAYEGDPWFGRNAKALFSEADERMAVEKPGNQHSLLELLWHMINWREFTISVLRKDGRLMSEFEQNDWQIIDHGDSSLWKKGLDKLDRTQSELIEVLQHQTDDLLEKNVEGRKYNYRKLVHGILQHDIYHLGQVAYIIKMLREK